MTATILILLVGAAAAVLFARDKLFDRGRAPMPMRWARAPALTPRDEAAIMESARGYVRVINESLKIANESKNPETKVSRLNVANDKLRELKQLAQQWPVVQLTSLPEVEATIRAMSHEFSDTGVYDADQQRKGKRRRRLSR